jgi:hypothetical protein
MNIWVHSCLSKWINSTGGLGDSCRWSYRRGVGDSVPAGVGRNPLPGQSDDIHEPGLGGGGAKARVDVKAVGNE